MLEAQHVVARPLDVQPLRQPVTISHCGAPNARAGRFQLGDERKFLLHTLYVLGRSAKHGVHAPVERIGFALEVFPTLFRRMFGLNFKGKLADGAIDRVTNLVVARKGDVCDGGRASGVRGEGR